MPRSQTLATMLTKLKAEVGDSISVGSGRDAELYTKLSDTQLWLASERDWPFLEARWDLAVAPNTRYYAFPTVTTTGLANTINTERPFCGKFKWNLQWEDLDYGINEEEEFNYIDSDLGIVQDPVERWRFSEPGKVEIWPIPASVGAMRFVGQRQLNVLASPTDTADLDDLLIVLYCGATLLGETQSGRNLLAAANQRLNRLLGAYPVRSRRRALGGARQEEQEGSKRNVPIVIIHG